MNKNSLGKSFVTALDVPAGVIFPFAGIRAPAGWLLCDGSSLLRSSYPSLFASIGTGWGAADSTHFNLPDFRGRFLRGVDGGIARDPDRASRTASNSGGNTGDSVGTVQVENTKSHNHSGLTGPLKGADSAYVVWQSPGGDMTPGVNYINKGGPGITGYEFKCSIGSDGGNETRPINANVNYIIKY